MQDWIKRLTLSPYVLKGPRWKRKDEREQTTSLETPRTGRGRATASPAGSSQHLPSQAALDPRNPSPEGKSSTQQYFFWYINRI